MFFNLYNMTKIAHTTKWLLEKKVYLDFFRFIIIMIFFKELGSMSWNIFFLRNKKKIKKRKKEKKEMESKNIFKILIHMNV